MSLEGRPVRAQALPEPLFTDELMPQFTNCEDLQQLRNLVRRLPAVNRECLRLFFTHLNLVVQNSDANHMSASNLRLSIPSVLGSVSPLLITECEAIFSEEDLDAAVADQHEDQGGLFSTKPPQFDSEFGERVLPGDAEPDLS